MLKTADAIWCEVAAVAAGGGTLVACLLFGTSATVTAILPVGLGVGVRQFAISVMKRRAWQRANAERS